MRRGYIVMYYRPLLLSDTSGLKGKGEMHGGGNGRLCFRQTLCQASKGRGGNGPLLEVDVLDLAAVDEPQRLPRVEQEDVAGVRIACCRMMDGGGWSQCGRFGW